MKQNRHCKSLQQWVRQRSHRQCLPAVRVYGLLSDVDPIELFVVGYGKEDHSAEAQEEVPIVAPPGHDDFWLELNYTALLVEVSANPREVAEEQSEPVDLLAEHGVDLVELKLVEDLLIQSSHVFIDADAVDQDLYVQALHLLLVIEHGRWLRRIWFESFRVFLVQAVLVPAVLREESLVQFVFDDSRVGVGTEVHAHDADQGVLSLRVLV